MIVRRPDCEPSASLILLGIALHKPHCRACLLSGFERLLSVTLTHKRGVHHNRTPPRPRDSTVSRSIAEHVASDNASEYNPWPQDSFLSSVDGTPASCFLVTSDDVCFIPQRRASSALSVVLPVPANPPTNAIVGTGMICV